MAVTHNPIGYTGTVDQVGWAKLMSAATIPFRVRSSSDWQPTALTTGTRQVTIASGVGYAYGVEDSTSASDTVTVAANGGSSTRYDAIVATFNWSTMTVAFGVIQGTTTPPTLTTTGAVVSGTINRLPGVQYDALLAIVAVRVGVGALSTGDVIDCRVIGGIGGMAVANSAYLTTMDIPAGSIIRGSDTNQFHAVNVAGNGLVDFAVPQITPNAAGRGTTGAYGGQMFWEQDNSLLQGWDGANWRLVRAQTIFNSGAQSPNTLTNSGWASTTPLWVSGLGSQITIPADGIRRQVAIDARVNVVGDGWMRIRCDVNGTSIYWPNAAGVRSSAATEDTLSYQGGYDHLGTFSAQIYIECWATTAYAPTFNVPTVIARCS